MRLQINTEMFWLLFRKSHSCTAFFKLYRIGFVYRVKILGFSFIALFLINCSKPDWDNPFDAKNTLSANDWIPANVKMEVLSVTTRKLSWEYSNQSISGFKIDRKFDKEEWQINYAQLDADQRFWIDSLIQPILNATCSYRVYAVADKFTSSAVTIVDTISIPAPTNLVAQKISESSYLLTWIDNSIGEHGFVVDRKRGDNPWEMGYDSVGANIQEYTDKNVFNPKSSLVVAYRVSAWHGTNSSNASIIDFSAMLSAPNNLIIIPIGQDKVQLNWMDASTGEEGYRIERKSDNGNWEIIALTEANTIRYEDPGALWQASTLSYRVSAFNGSFSSANVVAEIYGPQILILPDMEISMNYISITSSLNIGGNYQVSERGICWSTLPNPTLGTNSMSSGSGPGIYTITVSGLPLETVYYVRSYAIHPFGIAYSSAISIKTPASCGNSFEVFHDSTNGVAPINKTVAYGTTYMSGLSNKCFITRNLGASRIGFNVDDTTEASAGWYWQFNTLQGYKHTGTRRTPEISWPPPVTENSNWDQAKDPCTNELGVDWRLPTYSELNTLLLTNNWLNSLDLFNSALKLHPAGALNYDDGDKLEYFGGIYSNTKLDAYLSYYLHFGATNASMSTLANGNALPIRCVRDELKK